MTIKSDTPSAILTLTPAQGTAVVNQRLVAGDIKDRPSDCYIVSGEPPAEMELADPSSRHGEAMVTLALAALGGALARRARRPRAGIDLTRVV